VLQEVRTAFAGQPVHRSIISDLFPPSYVFIRFGDFIIVG
jgi:hypothetical protein